MHRKKLIVDSFAGGGGVSLGITWATGREPDVAINHDLDAIRMHKVNHPHTKHYCEDVWMVDPLEATDGRPVGLLWLSPDCTHHSKARGGKPADKNIRGLAWVAIRWARAVRPDVIILENVEEFQGWGPLIDGKPDPARKGHTFRAFVNMLRRLGYRVDWRELKACDYGAPTSRNRFFLIARCDGCQIVWPEPTHGDPDTLEVACGIKQPWRTAYEIIDWSRPCPSIFNRKRPLVENTLIRIAKGMEKFVLRNPEPFIIKVNHTGSEGFRGQSIHEPLQTITAKNGWGLVTPFITSYHSTTANETRGQLIDTPLHTIDTSNRHALVAPWLIKMNNGNIGSMMTEPVHTITAGGLHIGEVRAFLLKYYGSDIGQSLNSPLHTITARDTFALVTVAGEQYQIADIGMRMLEPYELFLAQGFPADYIIDRDFQGKKYSKAAQVARCGNSVPPPVAEALVRANLPEMCENKVKKVVNM